MLPETWNDPFHVGTVFESVSSFQFHHAVDCLLPQDSIFLLTNDFTKCRQLTEITQKNNGTIPMSQILSVSALSQFVIERLQNVSDASHGNFINDAKPSVLECINFCFTCMGCFACKMKFLASCLSSNFSCC